MKLSLVVPCYNEQDNIPLFYEAVKKDFANASFDYELVFVNDGSKDGTLANLKALLAGEIPVKVVSFSRNFGKEAAMYAGLENASGDYVTIIDADLQQQPAIALEMVNILESEPEFDCVAAYQETRKEKGPMVFLKNSFYKTVNRFTDVEFMPGASDFRTFRRPMVDAVLGMKEYFRFSKGLFSWVGFNTKFLPYVVQERASGETKWSLRKLFAYALDGIISFTTAPLRIPAYAGAVSMLVSLVYLIVSAVLRLGFHHPFTTANWIIFLLMFIGGMILMSAGIIGEYLAKVYIQTKERPIYIAKEILSNREEAE
ncbi:MAG: glycosyltransferase family 2 protein [Clostridia bacterium]|nr:glycosyltransferase family 2 protein [Clostridia bacterium]